MSGRRAKKKSGKGARRFRGLYSWGSSRSGETGVYIGKPVKYPTKVGLDDAVELIEAGEAFSIVSYGASTFRG